MKKEISLFLAIVILVGTVCCVIFSSNAFTEGELDDTQISVKGENSVGDIIAESVTETQSFSKAGNRISEVVISGNIATVTLKTVFLSKLVVAIYNEEGNTLITTGYIDVNENDNIVDVEINIDEMPQYFYLKAYLIDENTMKPVSESYESSYYTKEIQDLIKSDVDDYDKDSVINLDEDNTNNFIVLNEDVININSNDENNTITSTDNNEVIIENIDENVEKLSVGDVFCDSTDEDCLLAKVKSIEIDNGVATLQTEDADLEEAFDYIKIISESEEGSISEIDEENSKDKNEKSYSSSEKSRKISYNEHKGFNNTISVDFHTDGEHLTSHVKGEIKLSLDIYISVLVSLKESYIDLYVPYETEVNLSISNELEFKWPIVKGLKFNPNKSLRVDLIPYIKVKFTMKAELKSTLKGSFGFNFSHWKFTNTSVMPEPNSELKVEGSAYIGIEWEPQLFVEKEEKNGKTKEYVKCIFHASVGGKAKASYGISSKNDKLCVHTCQNCITGEIDIEAKIYVKAKLFDKETLSFERTFLDESWKIKDFYYSFDHNTFAFTTCPYYKYKTKIEVLDNRSNPVPEAIVTIKDKSYQTNSSGFIEIFLAAGNYTINAHKDGVGDIVQNIEFKDATNVSVILRKKVTLSDISSSDFRTMSRFGNHAYMIVETGVTWHEAKQICEEMGGHLVTITDVDEQNFVYNQVKTNGSKNLYWLGGTDEVTEGQWKWITGERFSYNNGSYDNGGPGPENWLEMDSKDGTWNDGEDYGDSTYQNGYYSLQNHGYICEWESIADYFSYLKSKKTLLVKSRGLNKTEELTTNEISKTFNNLDINKIYLFYAIKTVDCDENFNTLNLGYMNQFVSDSNTITIDFTVPDNPDLYSYFITEYDCEDISEAIVTQESFDYDEQEHYCDPVVLYNEELLVNGKDYYISADISAVDPGTYKLIINGIRRFDGSIECEYKVHKWDDGIVTVENGCFSNGQIEYCCIDCGEIKYETIDAYGSHDYNYSQTVNPTCTAKGYDIYKCSRCDASEHRNNVNALGHDFVYTITVEPTCTERGYNVYECRRCNTAQNTDWVDVINHEYQLIETIEPTIIKSGTTLYECIACGSKYYEYISKTINWEPIASSDFTKVQNVVTNGSLGEVPTYNGMGTGMEWSTGVYTQNGMASKSEDGAISIPCGYMYLSGYSEGSVPISGLSKWKIDLGFRFKGNYSDEYYNTNNRYCFMKMFVYTDYLTNPPVSDTPKATDIYKYCYFAQDANGLCYSWEPEYVVGNKSKNTSVCTGSDSLTAGINYHYIAEFDGDSFNAYITDDNGIVVQKIVSTQNTDFIEQLKNSIYYDITSMKIGDDNNSYFYDGLEYRNITFYADGLEGHTHVFEETSHIIPSIYKDGGIIYTCGGCGAIYTEIIPKLGNWEPIASSDFTKVQNVVTNGSLGEVPTYNGMGTGMEWSTGVYTQNGMVSKSEDGAIFIPDGYMSLTGYSRGSVPITGHSKWKIDFGFRFKNNYSDKYYDSNNRYCFMKMFIYTDYLSYPPLSDTPEATDIYKYCYFAQDANGLCYSWEPEYVVGVKSKNTSVCTGSDNLTAGVNYHYIAEFNGEVFKAYITDDNGIVVQRIVSTRNTDFIEHLKTSSNYDITSMKIGDDNNSYFFRDLEYRNITFYTGDIPDPSALCAAVDEARTYTNAMYTRESIEHLYEIADEYAQIIGCASSQQEYDDATFAIREAIYNLDSLSNYTVSLFENGVVTLVNSEGNETTVMFADNINGYCAPLDVVKDGIINAKDYAWLIKNCSEESSQ